MTCDVDTSLPVAPQILKLQQQDQADDKEEAEDEQRLEYLEKTEELLEDQAKQDRLDEIKTSVDLLTKTTESLFETARKNLGAF